MEITTLFKVYKDVKHYNLLLWKYGFITSEEADKLEEYAQWYDRKIKKEEEIWRRQEVDKWEDVDQEFKRDARVRYMKSVAHNTQKQVEEARQRQAKAVYITKKKQEYEQAKKDQQHAIKKIMNIQNTINRIKAGDEITEDMTERARKYPIEKLVKTHKNMAKCVNHSDKKPSMCTKNNYAYCFSCGYHADTIALAMKLHSMSFTEAVRYLQS